MLTIPRLRRRAAQWLCPPSLLRSETANGMQALATLHTEGFTWDGPGNPIDDIGTALRLAKQHGIEIGPGFTYASCRAQLPPERWKAQPAVAYFPDGSWTDRATVQEAVVSCLLSCRSIGVL